MANKTLNDLRPNCLIKFAYMRHWRDLPEPGVFIGMYLGVESGNNYEHYKIGHPVNIIDGKCSCAVLGLGNPDDYMVWPTFPADADFWMKHTKEFIDSAANNGYNPVIEEKFDESVLYSGDKFFKGDVWNGYKDREV